MIKYPIILYSKKPVLHIITNQPPKYQFYTQKSPLAKGEKGQS